MEKLCHIFSAVVHIFLTTCYNRAAQKVVEPSNLKTTLPGLHNFLNETAFLSLDLISGLISGLLYTGFFALCPAMFKMIANAGSQATSVQEAEKYALHYYWYFMLTTAFVFTVSSFYHMLLTKLYIILYIFRVLCKVYC